MAKTIGHFYRYIKHDETMRMNYLKERNLLDDDDNIRTCTKTKINVTCGGKLKEVLRNNNKRNSDEGYKQYVSLRCSKIGCQTFYSIRATNTFFFYILTY